MGRDSLIEELDKLLDDAITEGRCNWDGYYGHNNDYHMEEIKTSKAYKNFLTNLRNLV